MPECDAQSHVDNSPAIRTLIRCMLVNLAVGVVLSALVWLNHDAIVAHQIAATAPADRSQHLQDSLSVTLWTRPAPAVAVALLYPLLIRRLHQRQRRGYRRVVLVGFLQLASLVWLAFGQHFPVWLQVGEVGQAGVVVAVLVAALRPATRQEFGHRPSELARRERAERRYALLRLVILAPMIAEVSWGSTRLSQIYGLVLYWPAYAAGAVLIREVARRRGLGIRGLLVLGVGYGVIEEAICLQSLNNPTIFPAMTDIGPRLGGVNLSYLVMVLAYHAVFSITVPILIAEQLSSPIRLEPWLHRRGLILTSVVAVTGFGLMRLIPLTADPHYLMPWAWDLIWGAVVIALIFAALRLPAHSPRRARPAPSPLLAGVVGATATLVYVGALMPLPGLRFAGYMPTMAWSWLAIALCLILGAGTLVVVRAWMSSAGWSPRRQSMLIAGALVAHTVVGLFSLESKPIDIAGLIVFGLVELALVTLLVRHSSDDPSGPVQTELRWRVEHPGVSVGS